jgi:hypothetical protein
MVMFDEVDVDNNADNVDDDVGEYGDVNVEDDVDDGADDDTGHVADDDDVGDVVNDFDST